MADIYDYAFFEGKQVPFTEANISIGTHAVQYGTGAFAGVRGYLDQSGESINIFRLPEHARRLLNSARLLRCNLPYGPEDVEKIISDLVDRNAPNQDVYIRPFIYKSSIDLSPRLTGLDDELAVYMMRLGNYLDLERGQKAVVSSWRRIEDNAIPSRGKISGAYANSAFAKDEASEKGGDEAIMLNTEGHVAEGSSCNLFVVRDGTLITAPINGDILEGITRRSVFKMAEDAGIPTEVRQIDRTELYIADEAFFCGTGVQVAWIESIDGRKVGAGKIGPITEQIRGTFFDVVRGVDERYADWLTKVKIPAAVLG